MSAGEARQRSSKGKMLDHVNRYTGESIRGSQIDDPGRQSVLHRVLIQDLLLVGGNGQRDCRQPPTQKAYGSEDRNAQEANSEEESRKEDLSLFKQTDSPKGYDILTSTFYLGRTKLWCPNGFC